MLSGVSEVHHEHATDFAVGGYADFPKELVIEEAQRGGEIDGVGEVGDVFGAQQQPCVEFIEFGEVWCEADGGGVFGKGIAAVDKDLGLPCCVDAPCLVIELHEGDRGSGGARIAIGIGAHSSTEAVVEIALSVGQQPALAQPIMACGEVAAAQVRTIKMKPHQAVSGAVCVTMLQLHGL